MAPGHVIVVTPVSELLVWQGQEEDHCSLEKLMGALHLDAGQASLHTSDLSQGFCNYLIFPFLFSVGVFLS